MSDHKKNEGSMVQHTPGDEWTQAVDPIDHLDEPAANPFAIVFSRLHGRWTWAFLLGLLLSPVLAYLGWRLAPVTYTSVGRIQFASVLPSLMEQTLETGQQEVEMEANRGSVASGPVILEALDDAALAPFRTADLSVLATWLYAGLNIDVPRRSNLVLVSYEGTDPVFAAGVVASILRAYEKIHAPSPEIALQVKRDKVKRLARASEAEIDDLDNQRRILMKNNRYGLSEVDSIIEGNTTRLQELELESLELKRHVKVITDGAKRVGREPSREHLDDRVHPSDEALQALDPMFAVAKRDVEAKQSHFENVEGRFGEGHLAVRQARARLNAAEQEFEVVKRRVIGQWLDGPGQGLAFGLLQDRLAAIDDERAAFRSVNAALSEQVFDAAKLGDRLDRAKTELAKYEDRLTELDNEEDAVKGGRIRVRVEEVTPPLVPSKDRRAMMAGAGAFGGFAVSFVLFFILGTIDQKTYGVRQLSDQGARLRTLGVMPNMHDVDEAPDTVNLATDCVHRIRARIEARRAPERGFALMVSSPFQGDGKTTLAVSLGWSYAESGYRTVLVDADFIGRSMTHQFGRLREPGLREIVRSGKLNGEVVALGHPNLSLLGVGFDRRVSAANLNPGVLRRVLEALREEFDIIILDTGPMTASIEALPVASVADGVVLTLRRGRSRARVSECIEDIRSVGSDYLGIVLNYADQSDCARYGSTSSTSMEVLTALEAGNEPEPTPQNPLIAKLAEQDPKEDGSDS
jgi:Mrp family chromosome partitioning ATPase